MLTLIDTSHNSDPLNAYDFTALTMTDVFISYSRQDKAFVQVLNQVLADSKYNAWVD